MSESLLSYGDDALDHGALGGPKLGGWSLSLTPPHFLGSSRPPGNERSSYLLLHFDFEGDRHPPLSFNCHPISYIGFFLLTHLPSLSFCSSRFHPWLDILIRSINWRSSSCSNSWLFICINFFRCPWVSESKLCLLKFKSTSLLQVLSTFVP